MLAIVVGAVALVLGASLWATGHPLGKSKSEGKASGEGSSEPKGE